MGPRREDGRNEDGGWPTHGRGRPGIRLFSSQLRQLGDVRCNPAHLSVLRVAFLVFVRNYPRRSRPRVQIAKAAITGEYVTQMVARLECGVLAVPVHGACPDVNHSAPRGIAISSAGRSPKRHRRGERSNAKCQFRKGHDGASLVYLSPFQHSPGSLAIFTAIRRASSFVSSHLPSSARCKD
jgi:hypothetical protein